MTTDIAGSIGVAAVVATAGFLLQFDGRLRGADEGYLWYGVLRTLEGRVPLRDFRSYEPGRYYWSAMFLAVFGRGLIPLRIAVHVFFFIGLACAALALRLSGHGWDVVVASAVLVGAWAYPGYKLFEPALLLVAVLAGTAVLIDPNLQTLLAAGLVTGLSACVGVNYGLYNGVGLAGLVVLSTLTTSTIGFSQSLASFMAGAAAGATPLLIFFTAVRGTLRVLIERRIRAVARRGSTNLTLPIPWPWTPAPPWLRGFSLIGQRFMRLYFVLLLVFSGSVIIWAIWSVVFAPAALAGREVIVACAFVGACGCHHAFSRADVDHLSQSIPPLLVGLTSLLGHGPFGWAVLAIVLGWGTATTVLLMHPRVERRRMAGDVIRRRVNGSPVSLVSDDASIIQIVERAVAQHASGDANASIVAVPTLVWVYPVLGRVSPIYDTYCVNPATLEDQRTMVRQIEEHHVALAFVDNQPLDGRDDLRFERTHPEVWRFLERTFEPVEIKGAPTDFHVRARSARPGRSRE